MRLEIRIDAELAEPRAVLYAPGLTPEIEALAEAIEAAGVPARVLTAKKDEKSFVFNADDVELVRVEGGAVMLYDKGARAFRAEGPLHETAQRLGRDFVRISKSAIVNIYRVDHLSPSFNGTMDIVMKSGLSDYISRRYLAAFKTRLGL